MGLCHRKSDEDIHTWISINVEQEEDADCRWKIHKRPHVCDMYVLAQKSCSTSSFQDFVPFRHQTRKWRGLIIRISWRHDSYKLHRNYHPGLQLLSPHSLSMLNISDWCHVSCVSSLELYHTRRTSSLQEVPTSCITFRLREVMTRAQYRPRIIFVRWSRLGHELWCCERRASDGRETRYPRMDISPKRALSSERLGENQSSNVGGAR